MQQLGKLNIDDSFICNRIEDLSEFDLVGEINTKELCWHGGAVENISDGTWVKLGKRRQCYKKNEAVFVFWDAIPEVEYHAPCSIEPFNGKKWNKNYDVSWRKEVISVDYGLLWT